MQKIRETTTTPPQGIGGVVLMMVRVRELPDGEALPDGAVLLGKDDKTPISDWSVKEEGK